MDESRTVTVADRDVFNCAEIIASSSDQIVYTLIKENVMRLEFPRTVLYLKKELNSFHTFMDCKVMTLYDSFNRFLPALIHINGGLHEPRVVTYNVLVVEGISIKEAFRGQTLLQIVRKITFLIHAITAVKMTNRKQIVPNPTKNSNGRALSARNVVLVSMWSGSSSVSFVVCILCTWMLFS
jgi:hypothetical protein